MGAPQYEQAGADVAGSGTTNTIPRWTGPTTLGDSGLIDDGSKIYATSRKFATGTNLGTAQLESRAAASDTILRANAQAGFGDWAILGAGIVGQQLLSAPYAFVWQACNPTNTSQFPIALNPSGGNVGIGTASPTDSGGWSAGRILDVRSGSAGASAVIYVGDSGRVTNTQLGFYGTGYGFVGTVTNYPFRILQNNALRGEWTTTSLDISSTSGYGLKLPATPGNTDPNTLDAYRDGGTAGSGGVSFTATLKGGTTDPTTPVTATGTYILIGKALIFNIYFASVDTTGASGDVYVTTNLAAALLPAVRTVGSAGAFQFNVSYGGIFADLRTDGKIYVLYNVSNGAWQAAQHTAGTGRNLVLSGVYMIP